MLPVIVAATDFVRDFWPRTEREWTRTETGQLSKREKEGNEMARKKRRKRESRNELKVNERKARTKKVV